MSSRVFNVSDRGRAKVVQYSIDNVTVVTNSSPVVTVTLSAELEGYTPIGIVGFSIVNASGTGGGGSSFCFPYMLFLNSNDEAELHIRNVGQNTAKVLVKLDVLYI